MNKKKIIELVIDENSEKNGINAVSVVLNPAIEENFIALAKHEVELKEIDAEKRLLMGASLIPNKEIFRKDEQGNEFYIYFSEQTVRKASEMFFQNSKQNNATLNHDQKIEGMTVVESWIVDNPEMDKSKNYGFSFPKGTWVISMKVDNDEVWQDVKLGKVKGFSIEGYFIDKLDLSLVESDEEKQLKEIIEILKSI
jgi:hypothetical protein